MQRRNVDGSEDAAVDGLVASNTKNAKKVVLDMK